MEDTWNGLLEFETRDLVYQFFQRKFSREASAGKIKEITSNFIQGREYFVNAERANFTVKPLLLYYGVMALSRGLILSCSPRLSEAALKPSHGLEVKNWQEALKTKDFGNLEISFGKGAFWELLTATENKSYFRHNSSGINWQLSGRLPELNQSIRFKEILQSFPDLSKEFEIWADSKQISAKINSFKMISETNKYEFVFPKNTDREIINKIFPQEKCGTIEIAENSSSIIVHSVATYFPNPVQKWQGVLGIGDIQLTPSLENGIYINNLGRLFILSYILGMTARYFPSTGFL